MHDSKALLAQKRSSRHQRGVFTLHKSMNCDNPSESEFICVRGRAIAETLLYEQPLLY